MAASFPFFRVNVLDQKISSAHDAAFKTLLDDEHDVIRAAHFAGAGGSEVVQRRTALIDRFLRDVHARLTDAGRRMPALLAVGGYGRGELNPRSDIDIMFLCRDEADRECSPDMLYALWDAGLDIGYSVRTVPECIELGRKDIKIRTALLESRLIAGEPSLYHAFHTSMRGEVFYWKSSAFIKEKMAERAIVRHKYGGSLYLREPNLKESPGGLRDLHTALWIACTHYRMSSFADLISNNVLTDGQFAVLLRSRSFLWRLRNELHYLSGRKNDQFTFDMQEAAARDFRYRDSAHLLAVERLMKAYFLHARNIREFYALVTGKVLPKPRQAWLGRAVSLGPFSRIGKALVASSPDLFQREPERILDAFQLMQSRGVVFSDGLKTMVREQRIDEDARTSPSAAAVFLSILDSPENLGETLTLMKDLKFLGRYIPEFRAIQALARHDYYHKYTVDEHILIAIKNLTDLWAGRYPSLAALSEALRRTKKRWVLFLAVLLHDLGKAYRVDHEQRGVELAERVLGRLGVGGEDKERMLLLIKNHVMMTGLSQRRELSDRKVIADFAALVRDAETLGMLYLLTYADISAVSPTAWTQWKATLLQDLYLRTLSHFEAGQTAVEEGRSRLIAAGEKIRALAKDAFTSGDLDSFIAAMPEKYLLYTSSRKAVDHLGMVKRLPDERLVIQHRQYPEKGYTELTVCAYDAYGMFYRTAGTIAAKNLSILRAQVYTARNGVMIDTFQITDAEGQLCPHEDVWASVKEELRQALSGGFRPPQAAGRYLPLKAGCAVVEPCVDFDNTTSDEFTIIDITAHDRVGLLYRITRTLYDLNLDIASAKIVTEGARVMDSFYVSDLFRNKITDGVRLDRIKTELLKALDS